MMINRSLRGLDAWTVGALADAVGIEPDVVERVLEQDVADGNAVRLSSGAHSLYVPGSLADRLADLDATPVRGERLAALRLAVRRLRISRRVAEGDR